MFANEQQSHEHSLLTLNQFYEYDDFMESLGYVVDLGCGSGLDLEWWATRTTRDDRRIPLNIRCAGVELSDIPKKRLQNTVYQKADFEEQIVLSFGKPYNLLWCHNAFQYAINPIKTLSNWWHIASENAVLAIVVPQTTNLVQRQQAFVQHSGCYYHHTLVSLIHMLAVAGWDCASGYFQKNIESDWISAVVYRSNHAPMDPRTTSWYDLIEKQLLPKSAVDSILRHGYLQQQDLVLPWMDKSLTWYGKQ